MNSKRKFTIADVLNLLMVFCFLRFGLVMTAGFGFFSLPLVVAAGALIVFAYTFLSKQYSSQFLRTNTIFLLLNIICIVFLRLFMTQASYISTATNYINQLIILLLLWGFYLCLRKQTPETRKRVTAIYLIAVMISAVYTFYVALNGHSSIIRNTAFGEFDTRFRFMYGGFDFIYGLVIIYATLLIVLAQGWKKIRNNVKLGMLLMLLLTAATTIISGYSTAFALILVFTFLVAPKRKSTKFVLIVVFVFAVFVFPDAIVDLIEAIPFMPKITSRRLGEMLFSFAGGGSVDYITKDDQRLSRILWSLQAFGDNPLLGVFANNSSNRLGNHTEWIDKLAMYGSIAAFCNAGFWVGTYSRIKRLSEQMPITQRCIVSAFILYFVLGFLNPISMVVTSAPLFILCPFAEELFINERLDKNLPSEQET